MDNKILDHIKNNLKIKQNNKLDLIDYVDLPENLKKFFSNIFFLSEKFNSFYSVLLGILDNRYYYFKTKERVESFKNLLLKKIRLKNRLSKLLINNQINDEIIYKIIKLFYINLVFIKKDYKIYYSNKYLPYIFIYEHNNSYYYVKSQNDKIFLINNPTVVKFVSNYLDINETKYNKCKLKELKSIAEEFKISVKKPSLKTGKLIFLKKRELYINLYKYILKTGNKKYLNII